MNHSKTGTIDTDPGAPFFVRQIVVSFDVGDRGKPEEPEQEKPSRTEPHRPRPVKLVSARRTRLFTA